MGPCPGTPEFSLFPVASFFVFCGVLVLLVGTSSDKHFLFSRCSCPSKRCGHVFYRREHVRQSRDVFFPLDVCYRHPLEDQELAPRSALPARELAVVGSDPRVDPVMLLGAILLLRGEKSELLFGTFTKDRAGNVFLDNSKKVDTGTFLTRFRADLTEASVDAAE